MNNEAQLTQLKAKIYDANEALDNLNKILSEVVKVSGLDVEKDTTPEDLIDRIKYLNSLDKED